MTAERSAQNSAGLLDASSDRMATEDREKGQPVYDDKNRYQVYYKGQTSGMMRSNINPVALKADSMIMQGHRLRPQERRNDFLK